MPAVAFAPPLTAIFRDGQGGGWYGGCVVTVDTEQALVAALRAGDEAAFRGLVERYHASLVNVAAAYVPSRAIAEEVAQETWLAVLQGLDRFEARSSLKTWIFRILVNRARTRGVREHRSVPVSSLEHDEDEPAVDSDRFHPAGHRWPGHWASPPDPWEDFAADRLIDREVREVIERAIEALPQQQREVITLRDVSGWTATEVCDLLDLSEGNQRVLLHRARSRVRRAVERHLKEGVRR
jgi:RNA polymerase sigma-70 factor (ECF subfamily)